VAGKSSSCTLDSTGEVTILPPNLSSTRPAIEHPENGRVWEWEHGARRANDSVDPPLVPRVDPGPGRSLDRGVLHSTLRRACPARLVSSLFSANLSFGFAIFNVLLVTFGLWCFFGPVLHGSRWALKLAWFWVLLELFNGCGHIAWAASAGAYRPGLATAPILLLITLVLGWQLRHHSSTTDAAA